jgi:hypothetical protein
MPENDRRASGSGRLRGILRARCGRNLAALRATPPRGKQVRGKDPAQNNSLEREGDLEKIDATLGIPDQRKQRLLVRLRRNAYDGGAGGQQRRGDLG